MRPFLALSIFSVSFISPFLALGAFAEDSDSSNFSDISTRSEETEKDESDVYFRADETSYDPETEIFTLEGNASVSSIKEDFEMLADRIDYYQKESKLVGIGNVILKGKDQVTFSKSAEMTLNDRVAKLSEVQSKTEMAIIKGKEGTFKQKGKYQKDLYYSNGEIRLPKAIAFGTPATGSMQSMRFVQNYSENLAMSGITNPSFIEDQRSENSSDQSFKVKVDTASYTPDRVQNNLFTSGLRFEFKHVPLTIPFFPWFFTAGDSSQQMFSLIAGNTPRTGGGDFNIGPKFSFVLGNPEKNRAIHIAPFFQMGTKEMGYGGMLEYTDKRTDALLAYGTKRERWLAEFDFQISRYNNFAYGWNSYKAGGITKQFIQLNDHRDLKVPIIGQLLSGNSVYLLNDISWITDSQELRDEEDNKLSELQKRFLGYRPQEDKSAFRYRSTVYGSTKPIIELGNKDYNIGFRVDGSASARFYTTGNVNMFGTITPALRIHASRFADLEVGHSKMLPIGSSPFGFDQVIQGNTSSYINAEVSPFKWLTLGAGAIYSHSIEDWVSAAGRIVFGPEDFKMLFSIDPIFGRAYFGVNILIKDPIEYRKLEYHQRKPKRTYTW